MSSSYYSDEDDIDIHVARRRQPSPMRHYVETRPRPRSYYAEDRVHHLVPERTVITTRSRSRERRSSPPSAAPAAPVIINKIYNDLDSDDEDHHRRLQVARPHRARSSASSSYYEYEAERARRELEEMKLQQQYKDEERRYHKEIREEAELKKAKTELEEIRRREAREQEEKRIKKELELKRLQEEEREEEERKRREKEAKDAVEKYKKEEFERKEKERVQKELMEKEYQRRLQEDLIKSGLDEKQIAAIIKKEKVPEADDGNRPTYTRMARRHLSIETLRTFRIDFEVDADPDYVLIKRWVPEWEQDSLWKHTKVLREKRSKLILSIDDKKHHHHHHHGHLKEPDFEWVRKKERRRSKSPSLLMYLAGAKPV